MGVQYQGSERRRFKRAYVETDLFYSAAVEPEVKMKTKGRTETASLVDLGEGGLAFVGDVEVARDTKMQLSFKLDTKEGKSAKIQAVGIVRYCFLQGDYKSYRIGLEFTKIGKAAKQAIAAFVRDCKS